MISLHLEVGRELLSNVSLLAMVTASPGPSGLQVDHDANVYIQFLLFYHRMRRCYNWSTLVTLYLLKYVTLARSQVEFLSLCIHL